MKTQLTILAGAAALLVAAAHADSSALPVGGYQVVTNSEGTITWRLNTSTGQLSECIAITTVHEFPDCYAARNQTKSPVGP